MVLFYIDESGNTGLNLKDEQQPVFVMSSLIIRDEIWFHLEKEYYNIVNHYFPPPHPDGFELHAIQLKSGKGAFAGMPLNKRADFRDSALRLLEQFNTPIIYMRIVKKQFEKFCFDNYGPGIHVDPYIMALPFVCIEADFYLRDKRNNSLGMLIFDEQKEYYLDVERSIKILRLDKTSSLKTQNILEKGFFVDSKKSFALQLSDLVAYYARKSEEAKLGLRVSSVDQQAFRFIEKLSVPIRHRFEVDILGWIKTTFTK